MLLKNAIVIPLATLIQIRAVLGEAYDNSSYELYDDADPVQEPMTADYAVSASMSMSSSVQSAIFKNNGRQEGSTCHDSCFVDQKIEKLQRTQNISDRRKAQDSCEKSCVNAASLLEGLVNDKAASLENIEVPVPSDLIAVCTKNCQVEVNYMVGPPGQRGSCGPLGDNGLEGDQGETGVQGIRGPVGPPGCDGPPGPVGIGVQGEDGKCGPTGSCGNKGEVGEKGNPGPRGRKGPLGDKCEEPGERGEPGIDGPVGPTGLPGAAPLGDAGLKGDEGDIGPPGRKGSNKKGSCGDRGKPGEKGKPGKVNFVKMPGIKGPPGDQGDMGAKGDIGNIGRKGRKGMARSGKKGQCGPLGDRGIVGGKGEKGCVGPKGTCGNRGPPGDQGVRGKPGRPGHPGYAGLSATGPKGTCGDNGPAGNPGSKGQKGCQGDMPQMDTIKRMSACRGPPGPVGDAGPPGANGLAGKPGKPGPPGTPGSTGPPGRQGPPGHGEPGPDGPKGTCGRPGAPGNGLVGLPGPDSPAELPNINVLMNQLPIEAHINFFAGLSTNFRGHSQRIKYDSVLNNDGQGYKVKTGCFVAPTDGVYFFMTTALRCQKSGHLYVHIMKNKDIVASTSNMDDTFESVSSSCFLELKANDIVWVKLRVGQVYGHAPSHYTNFMGYRTTNLTEEKNIKYARDTEDAEEDLLMSEDRIAERLAEFQVAAALKDQEIGFPQME